MTVLLSWIINIYFVNFRNGQSQKRESIQTNKNKLQHTHTFAISSTENDVIDVPGGIEKSITKQPDRQNMEISSNYVFKVKNESDEATHVERFKVNAQDMMSDDSNKFKNNTYNYLVSDDQKSSDSVSEEFQSVEFESENNSRISKKKSSKSKSSKQTGLPRNNTRRVKNSDQMLQYTNQMMQNQVNYDLNSVSYNILSCNYLTVL